MRGQASRRRRFLVRIHSVGLHLPSSTPRIRLVEHRAIDLALEGRIHSSEADIHIVGRERRRSEAIREACLGPRPGLCLQS